mmetsp:Transcript_40314/g.93404  ORF Transcript_40314/g.93404 Transcript_40314/m.93404 type:complete len:318 (+) Transcript_40314:1332-2285(+)
MARTAARWWRCCSRGHRQRQRRRSLSWNACCACSHSLRRARRRQGASQTHWQPLAGVCAAGERGGHSSRCSAPLRWVGLSYDSSTRHAYSSGSARTPRTHPPSARPLLRCLDCTPRSKATTSRRQSVRPSEGRAWTNSTSTRVPPHSHSQRTESSSRSRACASSRRCCTHSAPSFWARRTIFRCATPQGARSHASYDTPRAAPPPSPPPRCPARLLRTPPRRRERSPARGGRCCCAQCSRPRGWRCACRWSPSRYGTSSSVFSPTRCVRTPPSPPTWRCSPIVRIERQIGSTTWRTRSYIAAAAPWRAYRRIYEQGS